MYIVKPQNNVYIETDIYGEVVLFRGRCRLKAYTVCTIQRVFVRKLYKHAQFYLYTTVSMLVKLLNSCKQGLYTHARHCVSCFVLVLWPASLRRQGFLNPTQLHVQTGK